MRLLHHLQHWMGGIGPSIEVTDFVPNSHPIRQWADTFPWEALVTAIEQSVARRFPKKSVAGRPGVSVRVLLALELLKHELTCSDEAICHRLRTDFAVMYACGIRQVQAHRHQVHFVSPESLSTFRSRLDAELMDELLAIQSAAAMEANLVRPAHVLIDKVGPTPDTTFPAEQGSQRVTDATTLYKAQKKFSRESTTLHRRFRVQPGSSRSRARCSWAASKKPCVALAVSAGAKAGSSSKWCVKPSAIC